MKKATLLFVLPLVFLTSCANDDYKLCSYLEVGGVNYASSKIIYTVVGTYGFTSDSSGNNSYSVRYNLCVNYSVDTEETKIINHPTLPSVIKMNVYEDVGYFSPKTYNLALEIGTITEYTTSYDAYYSSPTRSIKIDIHEFVHKSGKTEYDEAYDITNGSLTAQSTSSTTGYEIITITNTLITIKPEETTRYIDLGDSTPVIYSYKN